MSLNTIMGTALINKAASQFERIKKDLDAGIAHCTAAISGHNDAIEDLNDEINDRKNKVASSFAHIDRAKRLKSKIEEILS